MMNDESKQPKKYDLVLGGNNPPPIDGLVLGGIEGVKRRLDNDNLEVRIIALKDALKYDREGIDLVISTLQNQSEQVQIAAYKILRDRYQDSKIKQAILDFNPYRFFACKQEIETRYNSSGYITFSRDGAKLLYCGSSSAKYNRRDGKGGIVIRYIQWNFRDKDKLLEPERSPTTYFLSGRTHEDKLHSLYIVPDTNTLITAGNPKHIFDGSSFNQIEVINLNNGIDRQHIEQANLEIEQIRKKQLTHFFYGYSNWIAEKTNFAITKNSNILATNGKNQIESFQRDNSILVWDLQTGKKIHTINGHKRAVAGLAISNNDRVLATASEDYTIKTWDIKTGQNILTISHTSKIIALAINPLNNNLIISDRQGKINVYSIDTGEKLLGINLKSYRNCYSDLLAVNKDGTILITRNCLRMSYLREYYDISIWNLITGTYLSTLSHHNVNSIAISPDGNTIATMGKREIKLWQIDI